MYVEDKRVAEAPVVESEARKALLGAVELLSQPGVWVNRCPTEGSGKHCALTAVRRFARSDHLFMEIVYLLERRVHSWVPHWNDSPDRRLDEVLTLLRETAELV